MIGLFGGAFDPIHFGHLRPALEIMELLELEEIRFIPLNQPPHKNQPVLPAAQRSAMLSRAIAQQPGFNVETCELDRGGVSYSIDTLLALKQRYGAQQSFVMLLGTDAFAGLPKWHRWEEILQLTNIIIMQRPEGQIDTGSFPEGYLDGVIVSESNELRKSANGKVFQANVTQLNISSTRIRQLIERGQSVRYLMPEAEADELTRVWPTLVN